MKLPSEVPVMTLPNATLFPQALLPLHIFEPRYRKMLADSLAGDRMFCIAMQRPDRLRESPSPVAGLGLIRVSVAHDDGTSHLVLQGMARVNLAERVQSKPYRKHRIEMLASPPANDVVVDALVVRIRELLEERVSLGLAFAQPAASPTTESGNGISTKDVLKYLDKLDDPEQMVDLVSCAVLSAAEERQAILETVELESRLKRLIHFLMAEILRQKDKPR